ncbi:MAG TPA: hypothetical protein VNF73_12540 [Candidatus Saccharimonadales bacterium]|nr:hypothetical protein [Candidatus Saccharimonadales bacterium]
MSIDEEHMAHPRLYGAPMNGKHRAEGEPARPLGPDDLPIETQRSAADVRLAEELFPRAYPSRHQSPFATFGAAETASQGVPNAELPGRPLLLRAIAGRLLGRGDPH